MAKRRVLLSKIEDHEGECKPTWINKNQFCHRIDGGVTGFKTSEKSVVCFGKSVKNFTA